MSSALVFKMLNAVRKLQKQNEEHQCLQYCFAEGNFPHPLHVRSNVINLQTTLSRDNDIVKI